MTEIHLLHFSGRCRLLFTLTGLLFTYAVSPQIVLDPLPVSKPSPRSYLYSAPTLRNLTATVNAPSRRRPADTVRGRARRNLDYFDNSAEDEDDEQDQTTSRNVTDLLNSLFLHYNKTFRPGYGCKFSHLRLSREESISTGASVSPLLFRSVFRCVIKLDSSSHGKYPVSD
ncbi:hypothetical protein BV898_07634 [Hypsibius exemplaris]|uniref:Uncharacterized protein n=1 Tax=Hypsibius exemplaris TaxID=2072580 RepID=A0A1W0WSQ0_HYPEX|nr:hypothetical protein BV898_07634 [Hypsibius exemplaris]